MKKYKWVKNLELLDKYWLFGVLAIVATVLSGQHTYGFGKELYNDVRMALAAVFLLDVGFWVLDLVLPHVRNYAQRSIVLITQFVWWGLMMITSLGYAYMQAEKANIVTAIDGVSSPYQGLSVYVISGISGALLLVYFVFRSFDPEMTEKLDNIEIRQDITEKRLELKKTASLNLSRKIAFRQAYAEQKKELIEQGYSEEEAGELLKDAFKTEKTPEFPEILEETEDTAPFWQRLSRK